MIKNTLSRRVAVLVLVANLLVVSGCGYLLYPERQGLKSGRIDPVVALLDAAGLLFYIVPGVIAFAVDFTNGTIFLPPGGQSAIDKHRAGLSPQNVRDEQWQAISIDGDITSEKIARTLSKHLGMPISALQIEAIPATTNFALLDYK